MGLATRSNFDRNLSSVLRLIFGLATLPVKIAVSPLLPMMYRWDMKEKKRRLDQYGLKHDDAWVDTPEVTMAIERLAPAEKEAMNRRLYRAFDLNGKGLTLPLEKNRKTTFDADDFFLQKHMKEVQEEMEEERKINWY